MRKPFLMYLLYNTRENGGNKVVFEQADRLKKKGYSVVIYALFGGKPKWFHVNTTILPLYKGLRYFIYRYDGICIATFWPTAYVAFLLRVKRKLYFIQGYEREFYTNVFLKFLVTVTYRMPFVKITISSFLTQKMIKYESEIYQIKGNGVVIGKNKIKRRKYKRIRILSVVSRYLPTKGIDLLDNTVTKLKTRNLSYYFTLVSFEHKPYSEVFNRFISSPKPYELEKLYRESDFLLATSRIEGFYIPGLEAMANGCILLTTSAGGVEEYARNKINAIVIRRLDELWQKDIINKIYTNKKLRSKLIANGYKTAKQYHWDKIIDELESIFTKMYTFQAN